MIVATFSINNVSANHLGPSLRKRKLTVWNLVPIEHSISVASSCVGVAKLSCYNFILRQSSRKNVVVHALLRCTPHYGQRFYYKLSTPELGRK